MQTQDIACLFCQKIWTAPATRNALRLRCTPERGGCGRRWQHPTPEAAIVMKCSRRKGTFVVRLVQPDPEGRFVFQRADILDEADGEAMADTRWVHEDASQYDLSGMTCPLCGFRASSGQTNFIHCKRCDDISCGGASYNVGYEDDGSPRQHLVCGCGNNGVPTGYTTQIKVPFFRRR